MMRGCKDLGRGWDFSSRLLVLNEFHGCLLSPSATARACFLVNLAATIAAGQGLGIDHRPTPL
jgi:hypothetical protein